MVVWACVALAAIPWLALLRARIGGLAAVATATLAAPALAIGVMLSSRAMGASLAPMVVGVLALAAAIGTVLWLRGRRSRHLREERPSRPPVSAGVGAVVALGTFVVGRFNAGSPRVSWSMLGDSASQLVRARLILAEGGLSVDQLPYSVPLPPAIVAAVAAPGRSQAGAGELLSHDLAAYATTWAALIVVICLLAGLLGYAIVHRHSQMSSIVSHAAIAATSLLPLGWFWTGYPVKFGFLNAHVALILLLASLLGYLGTLRRLGVGLAIQALAIVLMFITWSPLAVLPATLALIQVWGARRSFAHMTRAKHVAAVIAALAATACAVWVAVVMLPRIRASLGNPGGLAEFPKPMLPAVVILMVVLFLATRKAAAPGATGIIALSIGSVVGLVAVLALSGSLGGPWNYYPHKYAWIASAFLLLIALPQAACAIARLAAVRVRNLLYGTLAFILAVSLGFGSWWAPGKGELLRDSLPYLLLVEDNLPDEGQSPDAVADAVIARVGLPRLTILWESPAANDYRASFWLIQLRREEALLMGDTETAGELWALAHFHESPADLCALANLVPEGLTVETLDETLLGQVEALCPTADLIVEPYPAPGSDADASAHASPGGLHPNA